MQLNPETRALVAQLVSALAPLNYPVLPPIARDEEDEARLREVDLVHPAPSVTVGQARAATLALAAGRTALAAS